MISQPHADLATPRLALFVGADADTQDLYRTFLLPRRYIVEYADDGRLALARALADPPDIVIMEARLPGIDGISLCELLRNDRATRSVPIVVLTADGRPQVCQSAYRAGATRVLVKPCLPHDLWRELEQLCTHQPVAQEGPPAEQPVGRKSRTHLRGVTTALQCLRR